MKLYGPTYMKSFKIVCSTCNRNIIWPDEVKDGSSCLMIQQRNIPSYMWATTCGITLDKCLARYIYIICG